MNPFRSLDDIGKELPPSLLIIFGATGDLTHRKLVPALYNLAVDKLLPSNFALIATARSEHTDASYRASLLESLEKYSRRKPIDVAQWEAFASRITYLQGSITEGESFAQLRERIEQIDAETGITHERIVYCATAPRFFEPIAKHLSEHKIVERSHSFSTRPSSRVIVEKPFGHDLASAKELNAALLEYLGEDQIYRIDHYLGKETVQNLLVFRFANGIFEPIWNHKYINHVEISVAETVGVGSRAGYFDQAGIIRDIVQNHVLQLLCLVALEPPVTFDADAVRDEKVKVLRAVKRLAVDEVSKRVVRGRYQSGWVAGEKVKGYLAEEDVPEKSTAETYMAMRLEIDSWRWAGVPFFLRAGKRLAKRVTDISIFFKQVPHTLFRSAKSEVIHPNVLSFQIQPDEGVALRISSKPPGPEVSVRPVEMDFRYGTSFGVQPPDAYERLLLDSMRGDATLFTRSDEIEQAWDLMMPILEAWSGPRSAQNPIVGYEAGLWGPEKAEQLIGSLVGTPWRRL